MCIRDSYYETEFCTKLDEWTDCHRCAALALVSIDGAEKLSARESDAVMGQPVSYTHLDVYKRQELDGPARRDAREHEPLGLWRELREGS